MGLNDEGVVGVLQMAKQKRIVGDTTSTTIPWEFLKHKLLWNEQCYEKAVRTGLEPVTPCVTGMYSNQLN